MVARQARQIADLLHHVALAAHGEDAGEGAERHDHVDDHVEDDALNALLRARRKAHQRIAHVGDRGIGQKALDVGLADGREGAKRHGGNRQEDDDLAPGRMNGAEGDHHGAGEQRHGGDLGGRCEEGRHRRGRTLIDVRRPHVEGHGGDLEGEAGDHEDEAEDCTQRRTAAGEIGGDAGELGGAGEAIDQRGPVKQHARGERTQHEVLEARFRRPGRVTVDGGQHIERQRLQFEAHVEGDEVVGRDHQHHADGGEQDEDRILEALRAVALHEADGKDEGRCRAEQRQHLHDLGEGIDHQRAIESHRLMGWCEDDEQCGDAECDQCAKRHHVGRIALAEDAEHQQRKREHCQHDFRKGGYGIGLLEKPHGSIVLTAARPSPAGALWRRPRSRA